MQTGKRRDPNDNGIGRFIGADPFNTHLMTVGYKTIFSSKLLNQVTVSWNRAYNKAQGASPRDASNSAAAPRLCGFCVFCG